MTANNRREELEQDYIKKAEKKVAERERVLQKRDEDRRTLLETLGGNVRMARENQTRW